MANRRSALPGDGKGAEGAHVVERLGEQGGNELPISTHEEFAKIIREESRVVCEGRT